MDADLIEDVVPQPVLDELEAFYVLEPTGGAADDFRLAYLLANLVQAQTGGKLKRPPKRDPNREPWSIQDFLISRLPPAVRRERRGRTEAPMTPDQTAVYLAQQLGVPMTALNLGGDEQ